MSKIFSFKKATDRKTECYWLNIHGVRVLISYETPVAFEVGWTTRYRQANHWGPTTGRHLRETGVDRYHVIEDGAEFERMLDAAITRAILKDRQLYSDLVSTAVTEKLVPEVA